MASTRAPPIAPARARELPLFSDRPFPDDTADVELEFDDLPPASTD